MFKLWGGKEGSLLWNLKLRTLHSDCWKFALVSGFFGVFFFLQCKGKRNTQKLVSDFTSLSIKKLEKSFAVIWKFKLGGFFLPMHIKKYYSQENHVILPVTLNLTMSVIAAKRSLLLPTTDSPGKLPPKYFMHLWVFCLCKNIYNNLQQE